LPESFKFIEDCAEEGLSVCIRKHKSNKWYWQARIYVKTERKYYWKALGLEYRDNPDSLVRAKRAARRVYAEWIQRIQRKLKPNVKFTLEKVQEDFFKEMLWYAESNEENMAEGLEPRNKLRGANNPITMKRAEELEALHRIYVNPFFYSSKMLKKNISTITQRSLMRFPDFINKGDYFDKAGNKRQVSPSTITKCVTLIRLIWHYALNEGFVDWIPVIDRPAPNIKRRKRGVITEEIFTNMIVWAKNNYRTSFAQEGTRNSLYHRDLAFQFYVMLKFVSYSGFRPSAGAVERTIPRWNDIIIKPRGRGAEQWYLTRTEKTQRFGDDAALYRIQNPVIKDLKKLQKLYDERRIWEPEYIFCHTHDGPSGAHKGSHIRGFRRQFERMLTDIGIPNRPNAPQSERLQMYGLRGYYITMRLRFGKMTTESIAKSCNTSREMVEAIYQDWDLFEEKDSLDGGVIDIDDLIEDKLIEVT
jgi:hypothetical protein